MLIDDDNDVFVTQWRGYAYIRFYKSNSNAHLVHQEKSSSASWVSKKKRKSNSERKEK